MITIEQNIITITVENLPSINVEIASPPSINVSISNKSGVASGGLQGQFLRKRSVNNYDTEWAASTTSYYIHNQTSDSAEWIVNHNLGRYPVISVLSVGLVEVIAQVVHISLNQSRIYVNQACKGIAQCV